jgi:hypothetical protein
MLLTFAGLFTLSWYLFVHERKPQIPEPPKPKTTEELLIGTWRLVNHNGTVLPEDYIITVEFTSDGKLIIRKSYPNLRVPSEETTGTYALSGMTLTLSTPDSGVTEDIRIEAISEEEMQTIGVVGDQHERNIYRKQVK